MSSGVDINFRSFADQDNVHLDGAVFDPSAEGEDEKLIADALKFSHLTNSSFTRGRVLAELVKENAVDANRLCENVHVEDYLLVGGAQAAIVCKGGCKNMVFSRVKITPAASAWCDVLWDDYSDQSKAPSTGELIDVVRTDGKPVRVVFGRFVRPKIVGGNCKIDWVRTIGLHAYNLAKDIYS